jgi:hypothetical protein
MEQRSALLSGIARILNAGGSTLLSVYDTVTAMTNSVFPGDKGNLRIQLREYERKIERLYYEIGKEVVVSGDTAHLSEAGEAGIRSVAEYQAEIEKVKRRIQEIEEKERAAASARREAEKERAGVKVKTARKRAPKPTTDVEESAETEVPEGSSVLTEAATAEEKDAAAAEVETPLPEMDADLTDVSEPLSAERTTNNAPADAENILSEVNDIPAQELSADTVESTGPGTITSVLTAEPETKEMATTVVLETMLKDDLLKLCKERGIEAEKRMTKAEIIELLGGHS